MSKLSQNIIKQIPNLTFSNIFAKKYNVYWIDKYNWNPKIKIYKTIYANQTLSKLNDTKPSDEDPSRSDSLHPIISSQIPQPSNNPVQQRFR